jgi:hypothetical protein
MPDDCEASLWEAIPPREVRDCFFAALIAMTDNRDFKDTLITTIPRLSRSEIRPTIYPGLLTGYWYARVGIKTST